MVPKVINIFSAFNEPLSSLQCSLQQDTGPYLVKCTPHAFIYLFKALSLCLPNSLPCLSIDLLSSSYHIKVLHTFLIFQIHFACPVNLIPLDVSTLVMIIYLFI
jgi:hypothetical protein